MHDENVGRVAATESLDGGRACVAGRRADHRDTAAALLENMVEKARQNLHGDILERQRGAVEKFEQPVVIPGLDERHDGLVTEDRIGFVDHLAEIGIGDRGADVEAHDAEGDFGISQSCQ